MSFVFSPICKCCQKHRLTMVRGTVVCPYCDHQKHWPNKNFELPKEG